MKDVILKVTREPYTECGECMFLSVSPHQVVKHGITDVQCNLFNTDLTVTTGFTVIPCDVCSSMGDD